MTAKKAFPAKSFPATVTFLGNGSGGIGLAFSTANRFFHHETAPVLSMSVFNENLMDLPFRATAEAVEEAVLDSMVCAETVTGRDGHVRRSLAEYIARDGLL